MKKCADCVSVAVDPLWPGYSADCIACTKRALTHAGVWDDDSQIDELAIWRAPLIGGMCKVQIAEIAQ